MTIAEPLTRLMRKDQPDIAQWTMIEKAHNTLKGALISDTVMRSTDYFKMFVLQTDASGVGVGAVLSQAGEDAPIAYFSRKLLNCERKYSTLEQECLAIKLGI